jgi:hypothetical protein
MIVVSWLAACPGSQVVQGEYGCARLQLIIAITYYSRVDLVTIKGKVIVFPIHQLQTIFP